MKRDEPQNRGFTLVELIVVILILGILAAIAVPALVGYIDKSRHAGVIAECRQMVVAAQSLATERHGTPDAVSDGELVISNDLYEETGRRGDKPASGEILLMDFQGSVLQKLKYKNNGITVLYSNGEYSIEGTSDGSSDRKPPSIIDPKTGETITFSVAEVIPGMKLNDLKGNVVWYEGDENFEAGYYYLSASFYSSSSTTVTDLKTALYSSINATGSGRARNFRLLNTETPVQTYNWDDWKDLSATEKNDQLGKFLQFGNFYYVDLTPDDGVDNPVIAMYRGPQEGYTYHQTKGDVATHADYWETVSNMQ